jgi:hypothetical protein
LPYGYLDYLTWQSRQIKLFPEENSVRVCQIQQNFKLNDESLFDPFNVIQPMRKKVGSLEVYCRQSDLA